MSGHWTDEQLIQHLYGVGPEDGHINDCGICRERLLAMEEARRAVETESYPADEPRFEVLAAQRRSIYSRIENQPGGADFSLPRLVRRWAAAGAMVLLLGGGAVLYKQNRQHQIVQNKLSDAQLAQEVSQLAQNYEPSATAPLQGLFDQ